MNRQQYEGALRNQCMSLPDLCEDQLAGIKKGLADSIPADVIANIRKVVLTGCGDSYFAARACIPAFKKFAGAFASVFTYQRAIDAARFLDFSEQENSSTLVVAISASGGPARMQECLRRANEKGCVTLAVTNNPESKTGLEALYRLVVNTPVFPTPNPGLRNYYASLTGLYSLAAYMGESKKIVPAGTLDKLHDAIRAYTKTVAQQLERIDEDMFKLATLWKDFTAFEAVGDDIDASAASFIAAKIVEVAGIITTSTDSEDWCHVNYFAQNPQSIGTVVIADKYAANRSRIGETVHQAAAVGRPVLFISNGTKEDFGIQEDIAVCTMPDAPADYRFLSALFSYVPGAILASYIAALLEEPYFRDFKNMDAMTIGSSQVVVVE